MKNFKQSFRTSLFVGCAYLATNVAYAGNIEDPGALAVPEYILSGEMPSKSRTPNAKTVTHSRTSMSEDAVQENAASATELQPGPQRKSDPEIVSQTNIKIDEETPVPNAEPHKSNQNPSATLEEEIRDYERSRPQGVGQKLAEEPVKPCSDPTKICTLQVSVGELQMLQLSSLHMNRLITPFSDPEIITTDQDNFSFDVRGSSIYFQPIENSRSLLYLRERDTEDPVMQLAIAGQGVVPRQISLEFADKQYFRPHGSRIADDDSHLAMSAPSIMQQVRAEFTTIAQMGIPDGFNLVSHTETIPEFCVNHNGAQFSFSEGQKLSGADYDIYVGVVSNQTAADIRLDETWCASEAVMAVAFWEDVLLLPGHESEVYVAVRQQSQPTYNERKSLVKGARR